MLSLILCIMNRKSNFRSKRGNVTVSGQISLKCLESHTGLSAKDMTFVIAERPDDGDFEIFPAVAVLNTNSYINLMTGEVINLSAHHNLSLALVFPIQDYFVFSAPRLARKVFLARQQLVKVFGQNIIN